MTNDSQDGSGPTSGTDDNDKDGAGSTPGGGGFFWQIIPIGMVIMMTLLALSLWRRLEQVDPVRRCADGYESSYTRIDTTLVDRIKVRSPTGGPRTTCAVLRASGEVAKMPRRDMMQKSMP